MAKFVTLDPTSQDQDNPFDINAPKSEEEILDGIENNPALQKDLTAQDRSTQVSIELAQEVLAVLNELENPYYDTTGKHKYLNWENKDISYKVLRRAGQMEICRLIKNKRRLDFAQYGKLPPAEGVERGARLKFRNPYYQPSKENKMMATVWAQRLFDKFFFAANDMYPNFGKFVGNAYEDFLDLDDMTIEIRRDGVGRPHGIQLQDPIIYKPIIKEPRNTNFYAAEDEMLQPYLENFEAMEMGEIAFTKPEEDVDPDYLLVYENKMLAAVHRDIVRKFHFFTRSDFRKAQRGFSIVEQGLSIVTWIRNALLMNSSNFNNNRLPKGFLAFTGGGVGQMQLEKLKKVMFSHMQGTTPNRFPMVGLNGDKGDAKWVGIGGTNREMEYHLWFTLLSSIWCQLSGTDPKELSLGSHADAVGKRSLFEESSDGLIKESRDIGARTFLTHLADSLNATDKYGQNIFQEITKLDVEIEFVGFEQVDKKLKEEITESSLKTRITLNEVLASEDKESYDLQFGGVNIYDVPAIGHPSVMQALGSLNMEKQQEEQMAAEEEAMAAEAGAGVEGEEQLTENDQALIDKFKGAGADIDEELLQGLDMEEGEEIEA